MAAPFRSMGKKRALLIAIRSITAPEYSDLSPLTLAHRDARELRDRLINSHGYHPDDIILMLDDKNHPEDLWPTRRRIFHQIDQLTHEVPKDCRLLFYYSGHGLEQECRKRAASTRADGREEEIVSADGKPILDYELHNRLLTPLEKIEGSQLFALLDCCHSESLLDLQTGKAPNNYSRVWNLFGRDQLFKALLSSIVTLLQLNKKRQKSVTGEQTDKGQISNSRVRNIGLGQLFKGLSLSIVRLLQLNKKHSKSVQTPAESTFEVRHIGNPSVICLSACRDTQFAHDDCKRELTFTRCFLNAMAERPNIIWTDLRDTLKDVVCDIRMQCRGVSWIQEPRICTNSSTDLTQPVKERI